jgi:ArsR family transcriptional regulator, arsenate/arsenite/antimonite-responsive transcriptional repressor
LTDTSTIVYTSTGIDLSTTLPVITCCAPLATASLSDEEAQATATLFRALSDPTRVKIVNLLSQSEEPVCVCELVPAVELSQPTVSHHLKKLTEAGLLEREERGKWAFYSLSGEAVQRLAALVEFKEAVA